MNNIEIHFTDQLKLIQSQTLMANKQADLKQALFIYVFNSKTLSDKDVAHLATECLHPNEQTIFAKRKHAQAQREYLATRFLLKQHLSQYLTTPFAQLSVLFSESEKLLQVYDNDQLLSMSTCISHSHGHVAIAICHTNTALGIDIEKIIPQRKISAVAKRFYHEQELEICATKDETALYRLWTLKEALAKTIRQPIAKILGQNIFGYKPQYAFRSGKVGEFDLSIITAEKLPKQIEVQLIQSIT